MFDIASFEFGAQVGLVGENFVFQLFGRTQARNGPVFRIRVGGGDTASRQCQVVILVAAPARGVAQCGVCTEVLLQTHCQHAGCGVVVRVGAAVVVAAINFGRSIAIGIGPRMAGPANQGNAAFRRVGLLDVQHVKESAGAGAQAQTQGGSNPPTVVFHFIAASHARLLPHHVQAHGSGIAQFAVEVCGGAFVLAAAQAQAAREAVFQIGLFGDQIDRAGGGAAPIVGACCAFGHLQRFNVEHLAREGAQVAHTINVDAVGRIKAAHIDGIAHGGAAIAFACVECARTGDVAQCFGQGGRALVFEHLLVDNLDGLRGFCQGRGVFGRSQWCRGIASFLRGLHLDFLQGGFCRNLCMGCGQPERCDSGGSNQAG